MGRAPHTKETLPDFLKWCRVTRHPLAFYGLTGSQRTPGFWGVTEFVACFEASSHALWLQNFVSGLGVVDSIAKPLRIYCDNTTAVFFSKNGKFSSGSKHMDLKYLVVKERV